MISRKDLLECARSLFHLLEDFFDSGTLVFGEASHGVGFLAASLDFDAVPEPAGVIVISGDFLPRDLLVGSAQPEKSIGLDQNLFGCEMDFLGYEPASQENGREKIGFGAERFEGRDSFVAGEVVTAARALRCFSRGHLSAVGTTFANNAPAAMTAYGRCVLHFAEAFRTPFHGMTMARAQRFISSKGGANL